MENLSENYKDLLENVKSYNENIIDNPNNINLDNLQCSICLELYINPVFENKNYHIFCSTCLKNHFINIGKFCPLCKEMIDENNLFPAEEKIFDEISEISLIKIKCPMWEKGCKFSTNYNYRNFFNHIYDCEYFQTSAINIFKNIVKEMIKIINYEINPHLKESHEQIHFNFCRDWKWLYYEVKDWKWWWWASNPWWTSSCEPCNYLWHKYEKNLDFNLEMKRIELLSFINNQRINHEEINENIQENDV